VKKARKIKKAEPANNEGDEHGMTIVQKERLDDFITKMTGRPTYAPAIVALFMGMRRGEVLALRWKHVDLDGKIIKVREALEKTQKYGIRFKSPKTQSGRRDIGMPDIVIAALREHRRQQLEQRMATGLGKPADDALVFPGSFCGGPTDPEVFSVAWKRVADAIGFPGLRFHDLRHSHASHLFADGVDVATIAYRLGHASPAVTLTIYTHMASKDDSSAIEKINAALTVR
jgi:integrase